MYGRVAVGMVLAFGALAQAVGHVQAAQKGGVLNFAVVAEPPGIDCHAVNTFAFSHPARPHYSTLLKFAGTHDSLRIVGDLADAWTVSPDGLTYTFSLHKGVRFHDNSGMTSADVKASFERIIAPPPGVNSVRRNLYADIARIETPDAHTAVFTLRQPNASMLTLFASPWNCIYRAEKLAQDPQFPAKTVLGTGAFKFVSYVQGSHWIGERFDDYFRDGRPYLDGYKAFFVKSNAVVSGIIGGQFDAEFRGRTPQERDQIVTAMKENATVSEGPWITNLLLTFNVTRKPFDNIRVRQALTMAIDRWAAAQALSKISSLKYVSGLMRPGYELGLPEADLVELPGFSKDIAQSRQEAKDLLAKAGVPNLKIKLVNRNIGEPYTPGGIYVIDQWRRIGVETEHTQLETKVYFDAMKDGNFDVLVDFISDFADDPSAQFDRVLSKAKSPQSASGHTDSKIDELFDRQARSTDPVERKRLVRELERYALTQAYAVPLLWWQRIIANHRKVRGWEHQATHLTGVDLIDVWIEQ